MKKMFIILMVISAENALCCVDFHYFPESYKMFRIRGDNMSGKIEYSREIENENCIKWQEFTGEKISIPDIYQLVYCMDIDSTRKIISSYSYNEFANWIYDNYETEVANYLLLAKEYEMARHEQNSAWYYPEDEKVQSIDSIYVKSIEYSGSKLADRYILLAIRCLFVTGKYAECLRLWEENHNLFHENDILYKMAIGYVAGALFHSGETDQAIEIYLKIGDMESFYSCCQKEMSFIEKLNYIYDINPNSKEILSYIQRYIYQNNCEIYRNQNPLYYANPTLEFQDELKYFVQKVIKEKKSKYMAEYYYTMSYLLELESNHKESLKYIKYAKSSALTQDLKNAIRILEMWVKCGNQKVYTHNFENYMLNELKWLDEVISSNLSQEHRNNIIRYGNEDLVRCYSLYYWNDMMRKIVICRVVPLCINSKQEVKALQYVNMADNRILQLVKNTILYAYDQSPVIVSRDQYRKMKRCFNNYDYQTDYFRNLDTLSIQSLKLYVTKLRNPETEFDKFLTSRSYNSIEFVYDIIGTRLTSELRFKEAAIYHSKVSKDFWQRTNVYCHFMKNPITEQYYDGESQESIRLNFAKEMADLETRISKTIDVNDKADMMLKYAKAIVNISSPGYWRIVSYSYSVYDDTDKYQKLLNEGIKIRDQAFALYTNRERAAKAYYEWSLYKTVVEKYGETKTAEFVKGHCDNYIDYQTTSQRGQ